MHLWGRSRIHRILQVCHSSHYSMIITYMTQPDLTSVRAQPWRSGTRDLDERTHRRTQRLGRLWRHGCTWRWHQGPRLLCWYRILEPGSGASRKQDSRHGQFAEHDHPIQQMRRADPRSPPRLRNASGAG